MVETRRDEKPAIQAFLRWQQAEGTWCLGTGGSLNETQPQYIPYPTLESYLKSERIVERLLDDLYADDDPPDANSIRQDYLRPFAILLCLNYGSFIKTFTNFEHLQDHKLPFLARPPDFPLSATLDLWEAFESRQWRFCPVRLRYNATRGLRQDEILPLQFEERIGHGGSSSVWKVKMHPDYSALLSSSTSEETASIQQPNVFVVKTYRGLEAEEYYTAETKAFTKLNSGGTPPPNIICFRGSFVRDQTYNVVLDYADQGTLKDFMKKNYPPYNGAEIFIFWKQLFGLFRGLAAIHYVEKDAEGPRIMIGWHQDLKPENILVRSRNTASIFDYEFLIADLGQSHFKKYIDHQQDATDRYAGAAYTYGAPETFRRDIETLNVRVGKQADLWSLGCIFSEIAVWIDGGWGKVKEYRRRRQEEASKVLGSDQGEVFHDGQKVLSIVMESHANVMSSSRKDDFITERVLQGPVADMLKEKPEDRKEVQRLYGQTEEIVRTAKMELENHNSKTIIKDPLLDHAAPKPFGSGELNSIDGQPEHLIHRSTAQVNAQQPTASVEPGDVPQPKPSIISKGGTPPSLPLAEALSCKRNKRWPFRARFRHEEILNDLKDMDHVFLIDNSTTMARHRSEMEGVLEVLGYMVKNLDPDGVDMFFTQSGSPVRACKRLEKLLQPLRRANFSGVSNMALALGRLLDEYETRLDNQKLKASNRYRRRNIYVMTDGIWQPGCDVSIVITTMINKLIEHGKAKKYQMGIQFIRFGDDHGAKVLLKRLDDRLGLAIDIVDTTPSTGNVLKMLLGATTEWFDEDEEENQDSEYLHHNQVDVGVGTSSVANASSIHPESISQCQ